MLVKAFFLQSQGPADVFPRLLLGLHADYRAISSESAHYRTWEGVTHPTRGTCPGTATPAKWCFVCAWTTLHSTSSKAFPELHPSHLWTVWKTVSKQSYQSPVPFSEKSSFSKQPRHPHHRPPTLMAGRAAPCQGFPIASALKSKTSQQSRSLPLKTQTIHANPPQHVPPPP